eukprot:199398_1
MAAQKVKKPRKMHHKYKANLESELRLKVFVNPDPNVDHPVRYYNTKKKSKSIKITKQDHFSELEWATEPYSFIGTNEYLIKAQFCDEDVIIIVVAFNIMSIFKWYADQLWGSYMTSHYIRRFIRAWMTHIDDIQRIGCRITQKIDANSVKHKLLSFPNANHFHILLMKEYLDMLFDQCQVNMSLTYGTCTTCPRIFMPIFLYDLILVAHCNFYGLNHNVNDNGCVAYLNKNYKYFVKGKKK